MNAHKVIYRVIMNAHKVIYRVIMNAHKVIYRGDNECAQSHLQR